MRLPLRRESIPLDKKLIFRVCLVTVLLVLGLGCNSRTNDMVGLSGQLIGWRGGIVQWRFPTGERTEFFFPKTLDRPQFFGIGPRGGAIVKFDLPLSGADFLKGKDVKDSLFEFDYKTRSLVPINGLNSKPGLFCSWIDYDSVGMQYLLLGKFNSEIGLFLLDSAFNIRAKFDSIFPSSMSLGKQECCYFVPGGILASTTEGIGMVKRSTDSVRYLGSGRIISISPDRKSLLVESDSSRAFVLVSLESGARRVLSKVGQPGIDWAAISPTGDKVAFSKHEGFPEISNVYVLELSTERIIWRKEITLNRFIWVP